jgi:glycosyltransferase involved in cell wall biosynthesis
MLFKAGKANSLAQSRTELLAQSQHWPALRQAGRRFVEEERNWNASIGNWRNAYSRLLHS